MIELSRAKTYRDKTAYEVAKHKSFFHNTERFNNTVHVTIKDAENIVIRNNSVKIVPLKNGADGFALKSNTEILALSFALRDADDHLIPCFRRADIEKHDKISY